MVSTLSTGFTLLGAVLRNLNKAYCREWKRG